MRNFTLLILLVSITTFSQTKIEDDFEGNGTITTWFNDASKMDTSFPNPVKQGINTSNTVLKYIDDGGDYANVRFDVPNNFNLSEKYTFTLKIYVPSASITGSQTNQISLKLQDNSLNASWSTQTEIIKTISLNQWQLLTFDFKNDSYKNINNNSDIPINRTDFNRVLIQINGENNKDKVTAYIDDFSYDGTIKEDDNSGPDPVFDNLVWSDEFNGNGAINAEKWHHQTKFIVNGNSWANGEIQHYTNRTDNSFESDGSLKILAKKELFTNQGVQKKYTSARLNSKFAFTYGKVEIRAKMPFGIGTFPALWMLGKNITETGGFWAETYGTKGWPDCGEIDIIEHWGDNQDFVQSAMHNRSSFGGTVNKGGRKIVNASTEFHIYTLDWNANKMTFSVDGIVHYVYNPENKNIQNWPYFEPQYLLFNVAILPNIASNFTQSAMEIDYVRVYQESTASVADFNNLDNISLFPNPVNDILTIKIDENSQFENAILYSITGKKIHTFYQNSDKKLYDVSFLKKGIYLMKIKTASASKSFKIIKN